MALLLINLRHVPDDEANEMRAVLEQHGIDFYETPPNRWGISAGGIWLRDDDQLDEARRLIAEYQEQRRTRAHAEPPPPRHPVQILVYLAIVAAILYFSIVPFLRLGGE
jgi:hypothetical protein